MRLLLIPLLCCSAHAAPVTIMWNKNPEPDILYRVWRGIELLDETYDTTTTVDLPTDQQSTIVVTAVSGKLSSGPSQKLVVTPVTVQTSEDLKQWSATSATYFHTLESEGVRKSKYFFRLAYYPQ